MPTPKRPSPTPEQPSSVPKRPTMKILQLNVWMGKVEGNLRRFLEQGDYDVICMQEVMASFDTELHLSRLCFDLSQILKSANLPYHFFAPNYSSKIADGHFQLGNLIISRYPIVKQNSTFVSGEYIEDLIFEATPRNNLNIMSAELENGVTIVNHHGFWRPNPIGDEDTIKAFEKAAYFVKKIKTPVVMCGDLNIIHDSPAMRPLDFLRDLTHEYNIDNTLSGLKYDGKVACDHILVSDNIDVRSFQVVKSLASDHLPLEADISIK